MSRRTVSHHMLRRTARYHASRLRATPESKRYKFEVESAIRGPFGWRVVRVPR